MDRLPPSASISKSCCDECPVRKQIRCRLRVDSPNLRRLASIAPNVRSEVRSGNRNLQGPHCAEDRPFGNMAERTSRPVPVLHQLPLLSGRYGAAHFDCLASVAHCEFLPTAHLRYLGVWVRPAPQSTPRNPGRADRRCWPAQLSGKLRDCPIHGTSAGAIPLPGRKAWR